MVENSRSPVYLKADVDASIKFGETVSDYAAGTALDVKYMVYRT